MNLFTDNDYRTIQKAIDKHMPLVMGRDYRGKVYVTVEVKDTTSGWDYPTIATATVRTFSGEYKRIKHCVSAEEVKTFLSDGKEMRCYISG